MQNNWHKTREQARNQEKIRMSCILEDVDENKYRLVDMLLIVQLWAMASTHIWDECKDINNAK